jgi:hypothetical protein
MDFIKDIAKAAGKWDKKKKSVKKSIIINKSVENVKK